MNSIRDSRDNSTVIAIGLSFFTIYAVYLVGLLVYNALFHPLAKFPGPKLRAASYLPYYWDVYTGKSSDNLRGLHERYGGVVRVSPTELSFNTSGGWRDIYGYRPGKRQVPRDADFYFGRGDGVKDIIHSNDTDHSRMRRLLANAFSESALREQESLLANYFNLLVSKLKEKIRGPSNGVVDIVRWYNFTTFDTVGDLSFGESFHALDTEQYDSWISTIFSGIKVARFFRMARHYQPLGKILVFILGFFPSLMKARDKHRNYTIEKTERRLAMPETGRKDFISYILRHLDDDKGMTIPEITNTSGLLILAGSETTATLLSGATYQLLANPSTLKKLQVEVRDRFKTSSDITIGSSMQLPYLNAVIEESLRIYPPVPSTMPRQTMAEGDTIDGHLVPGKTTVGVNQYATNHATRNFRDPEKFHPERWLGDVDYKDDKREVLQPFSVGPRNCLGRTLAYAEMRSILARMMWHFEMELMPESKNWMTGQGVFFLWDKPPLKIRLSERALD